MFYLTKLAAECTARRMVPDYISEKKMKELKEGNVFGCMGAVSKDSVVRYKIRGEMYMESIESMYNRVLNRYELKEECQFNQEGNPNKDLNLKDLDVEIYDNGCKKYVKCEMMNKNLTAQFKMYVMSAFNQNNTVKLTMTEDHPLMVIRRDPSRTDYDIKHCVELQCKDIHNGDHIFVSGDIDSDPIVYTVCGIDEVSLLNDKYVYDVTTETGHFMVNNIYSHNCRSFLSVWRDPENGNKPKFWGRFNKGVVTINLPDVALTIRDKYGENPVKNSEAMKEFWKLLDDRLELCHKALKIGCEYLKGTKSDVAPIIWQDGAIARLKPGETIDKFLKGGYSTTSLGYVGLYETMMALTGKPHTDVDNRELALDIVKYMNDKCSYWNTLPDEDYGYSLYGTPEESTTYKFATALQKRHGIIKDITDKLYVINSYHWNVKDGIDAFTKISTEALFQKYTTGGAISYVETPSMINNVPAVLAVMRHIYDNIMYAELNCKLDYCHKCGYDGEITMVEDENKKLIWKCPNCGNTDRNSMNVIRRVCGYMMNSSATNLGRMHEIKDRALNL